MNDDPWLTLAYFTARSNWVICMFWEKEVYINGLGHMTKMVTMPIYGKNFKNLLQNQKSYDLETWHVSLGTQNDYMEGSGNATIK